MSDKPFVFKKFQILQNRSAMKVGTDAVLLGAWVDCLEAQKILDVGTGTGLIAIMLAQRSINSQIAAIEIDKKAFEDASENVKNCVWSKQIFLQNISLQDFTLLSSEKYDLMVSNPPFFKNSKVSKNQQRTIARHQKTLNSEDLIFAAKKVLNYQGRLAVIIPTENFSDYTENATKAGFFLTKKVNIKPTPQKQVRRLLLEFSKQKKVCQTTELVVEEFGRHNYSQAYRTLTADFYLNF